jgi:hypothetical protein
MERNGRHYLGIDFRPGTGLAKKFSSICAMPLWQSTLQHSRQRDFLPSSSSPSEDVYSHINRTYHGSLALR